MSGIRFLSSLAGVVLRCFAALALTCPPLLGLAGDLGNQFVTAKLAYGASVSIPKSWRVLVGGELRSVETAVGAAIDLSGYASMVEGTETLIVASFPDTVLYAGVTITSTRMLGSNPLLPEALSASQISSGELTIRKGTEEVQRRLGMTVSGWTQLRKATLGGKTVMHISYLRSSDVGPRRVHLYKVFGSGRVYDLALATSATGEFANNVVLERIADSFVGP